MKPLQWLHRRNTHDRPGRVRRARITLWLAAAVALTGCATTLVERAEQLSRQGQYEQALTLLGEALRQHPQDPTLLTAHSRQRERVLTQVLTQADLALAAGRTSEAERLLERLHALDPQHAHTSRLAAALRSELASRSSAAREAAQAAEEAAAAAAKPAPDRPPATGLGPAFQRPVTLEFRDAALRQVFESLARSSAINFVFDRDVRADARVNLMLRGVPLEEALRVILSTQQLASKALNENTLLVYPNTAAKQREHLELVTRSLFLVNADVRQVLPMVRTMAKTRDLHADERLNALVVRDTPEAVALVAALVATIDLPEPEVTLAVEVLEVASDRLDALGLRWPQTIQYGLPGSPTGSVVPLSEAGLRGLRGSVLNPALALELRGSSGSTNVLANPTIRARNREKAKVQIGERLPVFTTTSAVNVGVSASVTYLDVGLKLDVEPSVQLDDEVTIRVALEVSNVLRTATGPAGSLAYEIGTRLTTTSLRLRDGETQVLAGLINDVDRQRAEGVPRLAEMPLLGRLFGVQTDARTKTEIVMLITPRIVRQLQPPRGAAATLAAGTDAQPGQPALRLRDGARAGVGPARPGAGAGAAARGERPAAVPGDAVPGDLLQVDITREAEVGDAISVTLANRTAQAVEGEIGWDEQQLQSTSAAPAQQPGRQPFSLPPGGGAVTVLRVLPAAAGQAVDVRVSAPVVVQGAMQVQVRPAAKPAVPAVPTPGAAPVTPGGNP